MSPEHEEILQYLRGLELSLNEVARLLALQGEGTESYFIGEAARVKEFHDGREEAWNGHP